jgi:hypothetical protein
VSTGAGPLDAGVVARENTIQNLWGAGLFHKANDNTFHLEMGYIANNILHLVFLSNQGGNLGVSSGLVRMDLFGNTESLYFNGNLVFSMTSNITQTGTITAGSLNVITGLADTSKLFIGEEVEGTNLPPATPAATTTITAIGANSVTLSQSATAAVASGTFTFAPAPTAAGLLGIGDKHGSSLFGSGTAATQFQAFALTSPASTPFVDQWNRSVLTGLDNPWSVNTGGFNIVSGKATAESGAVVSDASLYGKVLSTVDENVVVSALGNGGGVFAEGSLGTSGLNGYAAIFTATQVVLVKDVNGTQSTLTMAAHTFVAGDTIRLTTSVSGANTTLNVFINGSGTAALTFTDTVSAFTSGTVGIFSNGATAFGTYTLTSGS